MVNSTKGSMKPRRYQWVVIFWMLFLFHASATVHYVDLNSASPTWPYADWSTAATNIQDAIDVSSDGDQILVTNGVYQTGGRAVYGTSTNRMVVNKAVTIQSVSGANATFIVGNLRSPFIRCAYLTNGAVLSGFTLSHGAAAFTGDIFREQSGGGVWCENNSAVVSNCVFTGNQALQNNGGAAYQGTLFNCFLTNNSANRGGGACSNVLINCTLTKNTAFSQNLDSGGGAIYSTLTNSLLIGNRCNGGGGGATFSTLTSCVISNNSANNGGGVCVGVINNCLISSNRASSGGGAYSNALNNCVLQNNFASNTGGGAFNSTLVNCTVVSNAAPTLAPAPTGGGVTGGSLSNCIIYYNSGLNGFNFLGNVAINYCCTMPLPTNGIGNITNEPAFVNPAGGDYHLQSNSPCINAGNNAYVSTTADLDGNPRIKGGTVDIGAYEYQNPSSVISYAWLQQYGLTNNGSADFIDSDGDGMNNWQEWIAGTNPTNGASVLKLASPSNNLSGMTVTWQSVNTRTYYLQRCTNLPAFTSIQSNIVGQAGTTSYTDTTATNSGPYFYRVGVQ